MVIIASAFLAFLALGVPVVFVLGASAVVATGDANGRQLRVVATGSGGAHGPRRPRSVTAPLERGVVVAVGVGRTRYDLASTSLATVDDTVELASAISGAESETSAGSVLVIHRRPGDG